MTRKTHDVIAALIKKGFRKDNTHHKYYIYFSSDGKQTAISTYVSHGSKELDDYLLRQMAKQCNIKKNEFGELVDCKMNQKAYEDLLVTNGSIAKPA